MDKIIRFFIDDAITTKKICIILKEHGYTWNSGKDLELHTPYEGTFDLIIDPIHKTVCYIKSGAYSLFENPYEIRVRDYSPPW